MTLLRISLAIAICFCAACLNAQNPPPSAPSQPAAAADETAASPTTWTTSEWGEMALLPLKSAPYPHESRAEGFTHPRTGKHYPREPHYVDSTVGFLIPRGFALPPGESGVDLVIHFHGHGNNVANEIPQFDFPRRLALGGRNVILILPQGPKDASDSGCGKLEDAGGLQAFVDECVETLRAAGKVPAGAKPRNIILSGHSGAYKVIGACLKHGGMENSIREVWLWDATYGQLEEFAAWLGRYRLTEETVRATMPAEIPGSGIPETYTPPAPLPAQGPERRLFSIFTAHLAPENAELMTRLTLLGVPYELYLDKDFDTAIRSAAPARFVHTQFAHNAVMTRQDGLQKALQASPFLDPLPELK